VWSEKERSPTDSARFSPAPAGAEPAPSKPWHRDWGWRLTAALGGYVGVFLAWQIFGWGGARYRSLISDVAFLPIGIAGFVLARRASRTEGLDGATRRAWGTIAFAILLYWLGDAIFTIEEHLGPAPFPSYADAAYLAFYPLLLFGILRFPTRPRTATEKVKLWLDTATVFVGGYMVLWYFVLGPTARAESSGWLSSFVSIAYPLGDLVLILGISRILLGGAQAGSRRALGIFAIGLVLFVVADVWFGTLSLSDGYRGGDAVDSLWLVAQFLMVVSAQYQSWHTDRAGEADPTQQLAIRRISPLPYLVIALAFGLLGVVGWRQDAYPLGGLLLGAVGVTVLVVTRQIAVLRENQRLLTELHTLASTDSLTGLQSRRHFFDLAEREFYRARRYGRPLSAMMLDIDHFKTINDSFGHSGGDAVLSSMARHCRENLRAIDLVGRYGGDELAVLLPETDLEAAVIAAQRIRASIDAGSVDCERGSIPVTISIGVASGAGCNDLAALLHRADEALYEAKQAGRNTTRALSA
jgi:diguanylate cyclase (GGDEF)-like protein